MFNLIYAHHVQTSKDSQNSTESFEELLPPVDNW